MTGDSRSSAQPDLICLGGLSVDLILRAPRLPTLDEKLVVMYAGKQAGGLVANTACAAARLGLKAAWAGMLGDDDFGRLALDAFAQFGVETGLASIVQGLPTDFTVILLDPSGDRTILVVPTSPSPPPLSPAAVSALAHTRVVYTLPQPQDWFEAVANATHTTGGLVAVDVEGNSPVKGDELRTVLQCSDIVFCSRGGLLFAAMDAVGIALSGNESEAIQNGARRLLQLGAQIVCVTLGKDGAWGFSPDQALHVPAYSVPVVDTTGAGDCFHAAFLFAHLHRQSLAEALRFANAAAALSVGQLGARDGLPSEADVAAFLSRVEHS